MKYVKSIFWGMTFAFCLNLQAHEKPIPPTFHAIIFADTKDNNIGKSTNLDMNNVCNMLAEAQSSLKEQIDFEYYIYPENYCSPENLKKVLNNIRCKSEDIVFFYYSGHGVRSLQDTSPYPQMCLGVRDQARMISVEGVDRAIAQKNPRLRLIFTDCCNSENEFVTPKLEISKGCSMINKQKAGNYQKLFLNQYGRLIMTSSKAGETSSCNEAIGGFFTYCLLAVLENALQQNIPDWKQILAATQKSTENLSSDRMHPIYDIQLSNQPTTTIPTSEPEVSHEHVATTQDHILPDLLQLIDTRLGAQKRLNMVPTLLKKHFAHANVQVEALGKDSRTVVNQESAQDFLERLSTSFFLINFNILSVQRDANQKITSLKVHEIYKQQ